jgi:hypothetical protein
MGIMVVVKGIGKSHSLVNSMRQLLYDREKGECLATY